MFLQKSNTIENKLSVQRTFITGDEWLYYKIYSGPKVADIILTSIIKETCEQLISQNVIDKWFFIRYTDPKLHLRVRFHLIDRNDISNIIKIMNSSLKFYIDNDMIWKVQNDTYQREMIRYGSNTIDLAEQIFFYDSITIVSFLSNINGDTGEKLRWLFGLKSMDTFLNDFKFNLNEKNEFVTSKKESFANEFDLNVLMKKQIGVKYRKESMSVMDVLDNNSNKYFQYNSFLYFKSMAIQPLVYELLKLNEENKLEVPLKSLLSSYIHMMINRLFKTKQRLNEFILYDFLCRYYKSEIMRKRE